MIFETIESRGLAHLSYLLGDDDAGVCAVIDPRRDVQAYLDIAHRNNARITHILETHIHADFVSGSRELSARTGAPICVSRAEYGFEHTPLDDGDTLAIGAFTLTALHTPGHTPEHLCYLVRGGQGAKEPWGLFTGDTLFAGEVGRPDLLGHGTEQELAQKLYHSLFDVLLPLGDAIEIFPAHGEGSPCGGNIGDRRTSTLGYERRHNPKLQAEDEDDFVRRVLSDLPPAPFYYPRMKHLNAKGPDVVGCLPNIPFVDADAFEEAMGEERALVLDAREIEAFGGAHIPGAQNIALRPAFPIWAGWMLDPEERLLLVLSEEGDLDTAQRHLFRIGLENVAAALRHGMRGWIEAGRRFEQTGLLSVHELHERLCHDGAGLQLLDVRRDDEWKTGHIPTARHVFAPFLKDHVDDFDREKPLAAYCATGFRGSIAASFLQRHGYRDVANIPGSVMAWTAAGYRLEDGEGVA